MEMSRNNKKHVEAKAARSDVLTGGAWHAYENFQEGRELDWLYGQAEHLIDLVSEYIKYDGFNVPSRHSREVGSALEWLTTPREHELNSFSPMAFRCADHIRVQEYREAKEKACVFRKYGIHIAIPDRPVAIKSLVDAILRTERENARQEWYAAQRRAAWEACESA